MGEQPARGVRRPGFGDLARADAAHLARPLRARSGRVAVERPGRLPQQPGGASPPRSAGVKQVRADAAPVGLDSGRRLAATLSDYVALTKPRLNLLVVATSAAGYYLGSPGSPAPWSMAQAVCGTALVAAGSA